MNYILKSAYKSGFLLQLIENLEKRPTMYISKESIFALSDFFHGYYSNRNLNQDEKKFAHFLNWINKNYYNEPSLSWCTLIWINSKKDEKEAFKKFFDLYRIYQLKK